MVFYNWFLLKESWTLHISPEIHNFSPIKNKSICRRQFPACSSGVFFFDRGGNMVEQGENDVY